MTPPATKLFYLARRNPTLSHEQFIRRWRQHGALAMQQTFFASISRYAHCEALEPPPGMRGSTEFDGIGIVWFREVKPLPPEEHERMREDELKTFSGPVSDSTLRCTERVLKPGRGLVKVHAFISRRPGVSAADFATHWGEVHGPLVLAQQDVAVDLAGYVQNVVSAEASKGSRLDFDGVAEFHFHTLAHLQRCFPALHANAAVGRDAAEFLDRNRTLFVVTDEVMQYGGPDSLRAAAQAGA